MSDTLEKLTEIYDVQIYGGKQKGSGGDGKTGKEKWGDPEGEGRVNRSSPCMPGTPALPSCSTTGQAAERLEQGEEQLQALVNMTPIKLWTSDSRSTASAQLSYTG
ncbi:hypothetical protein JOQ06_029098 [Pogonophryne albipinna]|uniref:Uncharacterized protein n=1 Tax=Pogonophryne albipinna TaxID=1090488 RepID=A0AAD6BB62_9TELE|nr:hypothetical protein JOQ06_029098 [Pogonophryne albipinna]